MTRGAVHHHFRGGKGALLQAVLAEQWGHYSELLLAPLRGGAPSDSQQDGGDMARSFLVGYLELLGSDDMFRALVTVNSLVAPRVVPVAEGVRGHRRSLDHWRSTLRTVLVGPTVLLTGVDVDTALVVLTSSSSGSNSCAALEPDQLPSTTTQRRAVVAAVVAGLIEDDR